MNSTNLNDATRRRHNSTFPRPSRRDFLAAAAAVSALLATRTWPQDAHAASPAAAESATPDALNALADRMEKQFKALEASARTIAREAFDPAALAASLGKEPAALLQWVRDHTSLVPYRGLLRGPAGVVMDRLGNSLDRALLLATLLRHAAHTARLANAQLTPAAATDLLSKTRPQPAPAPAQPAPTADFAKFKEFGLSEAELKARHEYTIKTSRQLADQTAARTAEQTPTIAKEVGAPAKKAPENAAESLRDHWWVQVQDQGKWTDLDPSLPDAKPGSRLADPRRTLDAKSGAPADASAGFPIDAALFHEIRLRVIAEQCTAGSLRESIPLEQVLRPADLLGQRLTLFHAPLQWPKELDLTDPDQAADKFKSAAMEQKSWQPVLMIADKSVTRLAVDNTGQSKQDGQKNSSPAGTVGGLGGFGGGFGGALGGGGEEKPAGNFTAEWIEYEFRTPGAPPRKVRREIFDLIGPAARAAGKGKKVDEPNIDDAAKLRRSLAMLEKIDLLPLACQIPGDFVEAIFTQGVLANRDFLIGATRAVAAGKPIPASPKPVPLPSQLYNWAVARHTWSRRAADLYQDRPNLVTYRLRLGADAAGNLTFGHGFDIIANDLAARPGAEAFQARLEQGVLETNAEAFLSAGPAPLFVKNTADLMHRSAAQNVPWIVVRNAKDPAWENVTVPPDVRTRIEQDLASGYVALIPKEPIASGVDPEEKDFGWWRINPATGETLGFMNRGEGQSLTERVIQQAILMIPSATAFGLKHYCKAHNSSEGMCDPCIIAAIGVLGFFVGFATGAAAWAIGEKGTVAFAAINMGWGTKSAVDYAGACIGSVMDKYTH
jgi:hypothetical protein